MWRWFFERFQERIEGLTREHVNFIDDVQLEACSHRPHADIGTDAANIFDAAIRRTIDLHYVDIAPGTNTVADLTVVAGDTTPDVGAIERLCQNASRGCLANTPGSGEQVRVSDTLRTDCILECFRDVFLTHDIMKCLYGLDFLLLAQALLGILTVWTQKNPLIASLHVALGAALLGVAMLLALRVWAVPAQTA